MEAIFDLEDVKATLPQSSTNQALRFQEMMSSIKSNTSKEEMLSHLRMALIAGFARSHKFEKVLLGDSATRIAINLISATCKGRGMALPDDLASMDTRYSHVGFLRPMRDFVSKEIAIYNRYFNLEVASIPTLDTLASTPKFSIDHLTEHFIQSLQMGFDHTIHTLLRSGAKLKHSSLSCATRRCLLCQTPLPRPDPGQHCQSCASTCGSCTPQSEEWLCYGCRRTTSELQISKLPPYISQVEERQHNQHLRDQIKDFLLEDDS
eukprot:TRINITY_DN10628_c0_g1_i1.p1 TRINITY_DN10628_c0_g1~~TRINITY_DN10628_c0_g1_i1.p1  ORF type:complete len:264 (+),score=76.65 TRINITY_DN10628_c0_g1_i1:798-1589(+)